MATKLYLPNLLEFLYHSIVEKGFNYLFQRLDREDYLKVRNESKARIFAEQANLEDKILLLSKLGMGCAVIFWDKEKEKTKRVEDIIIGYIDTNENDLTKVIVKDKVFACKDIDFIKSLSTVSHSSMSKVYSINRRFLTIKDNAIKTRTLVNKLEAERNLQWYTQTVLFAFEIPEILEGFKIDLVQFKILLFLQTCPNGARRETISKKVDRLNITGCISDMYAINLVDYHLHDKNVIVIGVYGVIILEQIFAKFP